MRKLLLLLFLCSLTSNALAKVEIWKCGPDNSKKIYMKLHTEPAKAYFRSSGQWRDIATSLDGTTKDEDLIVRYSEEQDALYVYKKNIIGHAYDFVAKEIITFDPKDGSSKISVPCKVIE